MTDFVFPSSAFPPFPEVRLHAPTGWSPSQAPGAVLALVRDTEPGRFAPNVVVTLTRYSPAFELDVLMTDVGREASARDGSASEPPFTTDLSGRRFSGRTIAVQDPDAGTLAQVHLAARVDHDGACDVIHLVGTCSGDRVAEDLTALQDLLSTVTISLATPE